MSRTQAAFSFAVVCEAPADRTVACGLAERFLAHEVDWIEVEQVQGLCHWRGVDETATHLTWAGIAGEVKRRGVVAHGRFKSLPGAFDERRARQALLLFTSLDPLPDGVLLVRDTDGDEVRVESIGRARDGQEWRFVVVLATPHSKMECWVLNGVDPRGKNEQAVLEGVRSELGFDPRLQAERLTAEGKKGKRNAKNVLARLTGENADREEACWRDTDLGVLRERGEGTKLADYFRELTERWIPVVAGSRPHD